MSKVKDVLENIQLPKLPKMHRPSFLKKKQKEDQEKVRTFTNLVYLQKSENFFGFR
jgi:hypothetical protein